MNKSLEETIAIIEADPLSAAALTLYALVSTMDYEAAGCMFKLNKFRDLNTEHRQLAYQLIELMVEKGNEGEQWNAAKQRMDTAIRG